MRDVWIVVPAYNEAGVIGDVITDVRSVFTNVVCVDDGSADDNRRDRPACGGLIWCSTRSNLGQGRPPSKPAWSTPRSRPGAQVFVTFDADGQHRVEDVVAMIARLAAGGPPTSSSAPGFGPGVSRPPTAETGWCCRPRRG